MSHGILNSMHEKQSFEALAAAIAAKHKDILPGSKWQHYKGGTYRVVRLAFQEDDMAIVVLYESIDYPAISFVRPFAKWFDQVEWNGEHVQRFRILT